MLFDDSLGAAMDVRGHVHCLQSGSEARVGEVDGRGDVLQPARPTAIGADPLVARELRLMRLLVGDLVGDHDRLSPAPVGAAEVVQPLEEVAENDRVGRARARLASVQSPNVDAAEEVSNARIEACSKNSRIDSGCFMVLPSQGAPITPASHELVSVELGIDGHRVLRSGALTHGVKSLLDQFPGRLFSHGCTDEVGVLVVGLVNVGD